MQLYFVILISILTVSCSSSNDSINITRVMNDQVPTKSYSKIAVIADPQLHNYYGSSLKQMSIGADIASKVALRPPELNILAPYAFEELLLNVLTSEDPNDDSNVALVLGDATNVACSGEYERFNKVISTVTAKQKKLWLMAHGNHDSYLMGTVNSYTMHDEVYKKQKRHGKFNWPVVEENGFPVDVSWWNKTDVPMGKNWRDACLQDSDIGESSPMNKIRWLAKYINYLKANEVKFSSYPIDNSKEKQHIKTKRFRIKANDESTINGHKFELLGRWAAPTFQVQSPEKNYPSNIHFLKPYSSYVVQYYEVDNETSVLLIDTSVCIDASARWAGVKYLTTNAGTHACIGEQQFDDIETLISNHLDRNIILAGHGTISELEKKEQVRLFNIIKNYKRLGKQWTYISAHTHKPINDINWGSISEVNIGSTTDWPMEAHRFYINKVDGNIDYRKTFYLDEKLLDPKFSYDINYKHYKKPFLSSLTELCRHLPTAEALSKFDPTKDTWTSPAQGNSQFESYEFCQRNPLENWGVLTKKLTEYLKVIATNMKQEEYRSAMLKIAASVSLAESKTKSIADYLN